MKKFAFALLVIPLSVSFAFAETAQLLDVVLGESVTEKQMECVQEKMVVCETAGLPVEEIVENEVEQERGISTVARRRVQRTGLKATGRNELIKLAVPVVPLSEVEQLAECVKGVMKECSLTDYQVNIIEHAAKPEQVEEIQETMTEEIIEPVTIEKEPVVEPISADAEE